MLRRVHQNTHIPGSGLKMAFMMTNVEIYQSICIYKTDFLQVRKTDKTGLEWERPKKSRNKNISKVIISEK